MTFARKVMDSEYRNLPPHLRQIYDTLSPESFKILQQIRTGKQIPLAQAIEELMAETPALAQLKRYKRAAGPERDPGPITPAKWTFGQYGPIEPGWKRYQS